MPTTDYRLNSHSPKYRIDERKAQLREDIKHAHPRKRDMYDAVRDEYKKDFASVYNNRCAYCAVPAGAVPISGFEIDHIICKSSIHTQPENIQKDINSLENLAFACRDCNRLKSDYPIDGTTYCSLDPDEELGSTFVRTSDYHICISEKYANDEKVWEFYNQMHFAAEGKRLDYLLSSIIDFKEYLSNSAVFDNSVTSKICHELDAAFGILVLKRNIMQKKELL